MPSQGYVGSISAALSERGLTSGKAAVNRAERMWGFKTETVPVVIGAFGLVKRSLGKFVEKIPGNINIEKLQKISLLGTAHILRKALFTN